MKSIVTPAALSLALLASGSALAADPYVGGSVLFADFSAEGEDAALTGATFRLGSAINENISGEVRASLGIDGDTVNYGFGDTDVDLNTMFGAYLRAGVPLGDSITPYAVIGFTRTELETSHRFFGTDKENETDVSYGLGVDLSLDRKLSLNVEYMNYYDKDGQDITGISLGIAAKL